MDNLENKRTTKAKMKFIENLSAKDFSDRKELLAAILEGTQELIADFGADIVIRDIQN